MFVFQNVAKDLRDVVIKIEPEEEEVEVEIQTYPVLKKLSVSLTDCRTWLEGRDFLSLGKSLDGHTLCL